MIAYTNLKADNMT